MMRVSLRRQLLIVVAAAVVPLAIMSSIALYVGYKQQREQAERSGLDIARAFSTAVDAELRRTISVLDVMGGSITNDPDGLRTFRDRAQRAREGEPDWQAILLSDLEGNVLLSSEFPYGQALPPIIERESFEQAVRHLKPVVGYLAKGPRGRFAFPVRVPVKRENQPARILTVVIEPNAILAVLNRESVPGNWVVAVADAKGIRVARTRSTQESLGTPYSPTLVAMMQSGGPEGTGVTKSSEGDNVFTAYTRARDTGWYTAVGQSTALVTAGAWHSFVTLGGGILLSIAIGILAALFMARRISEPMVHLRDAAIVMGRGESFEAIASEIQEIHAVSATLSAAAQEQARAREEREDLLKREQAARTSAEAANRAKDEFLAMLGHELRNPLGAISNAAHLLESGKLDEARAARARAVIGRQVSHLTRLMDDLLDAGRALMGKIVLRGQTLELGVQVAQSLATLKGAQRLDDHLLTEDFEAAWAHVDPIRLDQIVCNLVVNAVKYTPKGGTIRVSVRGEGREAVLRVADNGMGLTPELAPRVFDLFVQGERDLDRSQGGLGIGLTLVRRLAELHGGSATVHSEGPGQGSEFTVRFPLLDPPASVNVPAPPAVPARARNVLIIEDNEDVRETLRSMLEQDGHRVEVAADGLEGLEKTRSATPHIVLLDVGLPGIDGYEVARRIRAVAGSKCPYLVALTGYGSPEDQRLALEAGFDEHVVKPMQADQLARLLLRSQRGD